MAIPVFHHFGLKVLSFALALLLWSLVAGQKEAERSLRVPLEFQNIPPTLELIGEPPGYVDVRVKGPSAALGQLRGTELVATMDLSGARPGRRMFHLLAEHVSTPVGVRALSVVPATVTLSFEASATRAIRVVPVIDGEPATGYTLGRVTVSPTSVAVVGPESIVRQLTEATTEPVSVDGAMGRVRDTVTIGVNESRVRLQVPRNAVVTVEIERATIDRAVRGVPLILRHLARGLRAEAAPRAVTVHARGHADVVSELDAARVPAFVDLTGLRRGRYNLPVRIDATSGFTVVSVEPSTVQIRIR